MKVEPSPYSRFGQVKGFAQGLMPLLAYGAFLAAGLAYAGAHSSFFDMVSHFRLHIMVGCTFLILLNAMWVKRFGMMWILVGAFLLSAVPVVQVYLHRSVASGASRGGALLHIAAANILSTPQDLEALRAWLEGSHPDIVVLSEYSPAWARIIASWPLVRDYPYKVEAARSDNFGLAIFSRYPIAQQNLSLLSDLPIPYFSAIVDSPLGKIRVLALHPPPPITPLMWQLRNQVLLSVSDLLSHATMPTLAMGDFNATPWSYPLNQILLNKTITGGTFLPTWPAGADLVGLPIDHMLAAGGVHFHAFWRGDETGSDHRAIEAQIEF